MLTSMTYQDVTGRRNKFTSIYTLKKKIAREDFSLDKKKNYLVYFHKQRVRQQNRLINLT